MTETGTKSAEETTKQIITLSTSMIGLTLTFAEKFNSADAKAIVVPWQLKYSWLAFGLAVTLGVWTLMAITGETNRCTTAAPPGGGALIDPPNANRSSIRIPASLMIFSFIAGIGLAIGAGFSRFG